MANTTKEKLSIEQVKKRIDDLFNENTISFGNDIGFAFIIYNNNFQRYYENFRSFTTTKGINKKIQKIQDQINTYIQMISNFFSKSSKQEMIIKSTIYIGTQKNSYEVTFFRISVDIESYYIFLLANNSTTIHFYNVIKQIARGEK